MPDVAFVILAAGDSSRLGRPKQLIVIKGQTLLERCIQAGKSSACSAVYLVLGANSESIKQSINTEGLVLIQNPDWSQGMASSIVAAVNTVQEIAPSSAAAILATCDQPFLSVELINSLISAFSSDTENMVACKYNDTVGVPALFPKIFFEKLKLLRGAEGARKLLRDPHQPLALVEFPNGAVDIDTEEDWNNFLLLSGESTLNSDKLFK